MKRIFKIFLGLLISLVLVLVLAAVLLPLIYDKDDVKRAIAAQVHEQTGRDLQINGALDFSVFPWLAVEVNDLSLSNAKGFGGQPFASIGKARVGVALMPLFRKQLVADEVTLDGLQLSLAVDARGKNNWDDLSRQGEKEPASGGESGKPETGLFSSERIAGLNVRDARIEYQDQQAKTHYLLSDLTVKTGALGSSGPVPVQLGLLMEDLVTHTRTNVDLSASANLDLAAGNYAFDDVALAIKPLPAGGKAGTGAAIEPVTIDTPRIEVQLASQTLSMDTFTAAMGGLQASGNLEARAILDRPQLEGKLKTETFSPRKLMQALAIEPPPTTDPNVLQSAQLSGTFKGSASEVSFGDFKGALDQSAFTGNISVRNFDHPGIRFDLEVDSIDLDRYMAPAGDTGGGETDVAIPGQELRELDVRGSLHVGALHLGGLNFSNAVVGIGVSKGRLQLSPLTAGFYDGSYSGNVNIDGSGSTPVVSVDEKLDSVTFQRLVADITDSKNLSGTAQGHVRLTGRGATSSDVLGSLKGDVGLTLDDGALEGVNIWYQIRRGYALYKGMAAPEPEPDRTVFSRMQLGATVDNGVLTTRQLMAELPFLSMRGDGTIDLGRSTLDLHLTAAVRSVPELAKDPLGSELRGKQLPFKVSGSLLDPKVSVDWTALLKSEATGKLLDKLGLKPQDKPSSETGAEPGQATGDETKDGSTRDQTKEAAKGMLLDLLRGKDKKKEDNDDGG